jgi:hypothetical protein
MKLLAPVAALCAVSPLLVSADGPSTTLKEAVGTVLYAGVQTNCDAIPSSISEEGGGSAINYCQATPNSWGFTGAMTWTGSLDLAAGTFGLTASGLPPVDHSWGMFTYGSVPTNIPFGNGYLCISPFAPGIFKMPTQPLGTGTVLMRMEEHPDDFTAFTPSTTWNFQFWYRDVAAGGANFNLTDGLRVTFAP